MKKRDKLTLKDVGGFKMQKGEFSGVVLNTLDAIAECIGPNCKAFRMCTYKKYGPCRMRRTFLMNVINNYLESVEEWDFQKIGTMLVPLWDQLCRLKIEEVSIGSPLKGEKLHPVFGAMRETIRLIPKLEPGCRKKRGKRDKESDLPEIERDVTLFGDLDYYDSLTQEEEKMPLDEI